MGWGILTAKAVDVKTDYLMRRLAPVCKCVQAEAIRHALIWIFEYINICNAATLFYCLEGIIQTQIMYSPTLSNSKITYNFLLKKEAKYSFLYPDLLGEPRIWKWL